MAMSEMEFLDLAPGDPITQGGSLREFRYSQFSQCPSAPFNTAEPECLPSQFHLSPSLATSPLLEFEGLKYLRSDGDLDEPSSSLPSSSRISDTFDEGVKCNSKRGEHVPSISDSLKLSLDAHTGSDERECNPGILEEETHASNVGVSGSAQHGSPLHSPSQCSPRRMYCDPRFLEEETQVFDFDVPDSKEQVSRLLSTIPQFQAAPQITAAELEESLSTPGGKQDCHVAVEDFGDICHRWHNRKRTAPSVTASPSSSVRTGLPSNAAHKSSTSGVLDADHLRRQQTDSEPETPGPSRATNETTPPAIEVDVDTMQRCRNKRRISLAALINLNSSATLRLPVETEQRISTFEALDADHFRRQPTVENASPSTSPNQKIVEDDADIVQRWRTRKRVALSAVTNLSSSSDKKLRETPDKPVELGARLHLTDQHPSSNDNENRSPPQCGYDTPCKDATPPKSGSETIEEDVNANDDTDDCCDSKPLRRKLNYSCDRDIIRYLQPVTPRDKSTLDLFSTKEVKQEHVEGSWTYPKKSRVGGRQRTMDAWIK